MALTTDEPVPAAPRVRPGGGGRLRIWIGLAVVLAALGFLLFQGIGNATVYFKTANEAVAQKTSLGTKRFRIEGAVVAGTTKAVGNTTHFTISSKGVEVPVVHTGDTPAMFKDDIPVVLEGRWDGDVYRSDRIMVKHSEVYRAKHPDRTADYKQ